MELVPFLKGLLPATTDTGKSLRLWDVGQLSFNVFRVFFSSFAKNKKCLFLDVKLKYLPFLMLLSEANWAAKSRTQRLL